MEEKTLHIQPPQHVVYAAVAALVMVALLAGVAALKTLREFQFVGAGVSATNTISVSGEGEVFAVADIATFTVSVNEEANDVETAQANAAEKSNDIIAYLRSEGVEERDIKTQQYNVNPRYEWEAARTCITGDCPRERVLKGYEVQQTLLVKVRDTDDAGRIVSGVGSRGATNVSSLSFTIDDDEALQADARAAAIDDARAKAKALANDLGVALVRVVGFSENGGVPMYAARAETMMMAMDAVGGAVPELPVGENKITANVTVTYEIR